MREGFDWLAWHNGEPICNYCGAFLSYTDWTDGRTREFLQCPCQKHGSSGIQYFLGSTEN
jgi:hypothetical protein